MSVNTIKNNIREALLGRGYSGVDFVRDDSGLPWGMSPEPAISREADHKGPKGPIKVNYRNSDGLKQAAYFCEGIVLRDQIEEIFLDIGFDKVKFEVSSKALFFWQAIGKNQVFVQYSGLQGLRDLLTKLRKDNPYMKSLA